jgi:hypothetical protein
VYIQPVLHPQVSNREDFLTTVALYDDDTGAPINLSGVTLAAANPNGLTASAWTVTDGAIVTTSATTLTIPAYPIGSQLTALALTVGTGLGILPGDPITIADTATKLNTMTGYVVSYASATGALVCQIGVTFQFEIRRGGPRNSGGGYISWYDWGTPDDLGPLLSASLGYPSANASGIIHIDVGFIQILIPEQMFRAIGNPGSLQPGGGTGTYMTGLTMSDSVATRQVFIGRLPVLYGGVTN